MMEFSGIIFLIRHSAAVCVIMPPVSATNSPMLLGSLASTIGVKLEP